MCSDFCFAATMGKKKISFGPKMNLQAAVMVRLDEKVEKEPKKGGVPFWKR